MKKISFLALVIFVLCACNSGSKFTVNGSVSGADGKSLYLEASQVDGVMVLDSVKLKGDGTFDFKQPKPESPEFYRLRVDERVINFSVDSTETVTIKAPYTGFTTEYVVEGSPNSEKMKELTIKQIKLQNDVNALIKSSQSGKVRSEIVEDSLTALIDAYKNDVKVRYIFSAPNTAAAYFALFQRMNNYLIFDPLNSKDDIKCFAAVATSLNNFYPHAARSKNLYNLVIKGMKNTRTPKEKVLELDQSKIKETSIIDISLKDIKGNTRSLTEFAGKVVLLDFTVYQSAVAGSHNFLLRDLYDKYASQGLEIYQVSLDADEHYWKTSAGNLPWVCVRDPNGVYSTTAALYNVQQVPAYFLINKKNELSIRGEEVKDIESVIKSLL